MLNALIPTDAMIAEQQRDQLVPNLGEEQCIVCDMKMFQKQKNMPRSTGIERIEGDCARTNITSVHDSAAVPTSPGPPYPGHQARPKADIDQPLTRPKRERSLVRRRPKYRRSQLDTPRYPVRIIGQRGRQTLRNSLFPWMPRVCEDLPFRW